MGKRCRSSRFFVAFHGLLVLIVALRPAQACVPVFIFGDSTMDVGTNNFLPDSIAKANFRYFGIDYPNQQPTGRFSNGHNTADTIARQMGHRQSPPSFFSLVNQSSTTFQPEIILNGVNFASGGSGIFDNTGFQLAVVPLRNQTEQFSIVRENITAILGQQNTTLLLSRSVFLISAGSNDIFDYQRNVSSNPGIGNNSVSAPEFLVDLMSAYQSNLQTLYGLGARKFAIVSIPRIGCSPAERTFSNTSDCIEPVNELAQKIFTLTKAMLQGFSSMVQGMNYSLGDAYNITSDMINKPDDFGFEEVKAACCGNGSFPCNESAVVCPNRKKYLFWDRFHPTQVASKLAALALFGGAPRYVGPITFRQLAAI